MPQITAIYWNVQNFGTLPMYKSGYIPLARLMAEVVDQTQADILFVLEVKLASVATQALQTLHRALCTLPEPRNNWYYDWIMGSLAAGSAPPYATAASLNWDLAHQEGYAVFWNQNIANFRVLAAPPIAFPGVAGPPVANAQSQMVRMVGLPGAAVAPVYGTQVPPPGIGNPGGILTPAGATPYRLPANTTAPVGAAITAPGVGVIVAANGNLGVATNVPAGTMLPAGATIGPGGVQLTAQTNNVNPIVIPGSYQLSDALALPPAGTQLVPPYSMSLVLFGRDTTGGAPGALPSALVGDISGITPAFVPGGPNVWQEVYFPRGSGFPAASHGPRRPAYITIQVNRPGAPAAAQQLIPLIAYHAPASPAAASSGMQRASYSQPVYQAYDPVAGNWIDCAFSVIGGDFNVRTDAIQFAYNAYLNGFAVGGANCLARVYNPPVVPPNGGPATRAANVLNKSTVQLNNPPVFGPAVVNPATNAYRHLAIDNVFYRGFPAVVGLVPPQAPAPVPAAVYDMLPAVSGAAPAGFNVPGVRLFAFTNLNVLNNYFNIALGFAPPPGPLTPRIMNPMNFIGDLVGGAFNPGIGGIGNPGARRAAEFVRLCVSDHQPVLFTMRL